MRVQPPLGTISPENSDAVAISGGTMDGVVIGANAAAAAHFTNMSCSGSAGFGAIAITGGSINGATIGASTPAGGTFTTLHATGAAQFDGAVTFGTGFTVAGNFAIGGTFLPGVQVGMAQDCTNGEQDPWRVNRTVSGSTYATYQYGTKAAIGLYDTQYGAIWNYAYGASFTISTALSVVGAAGFSSTVYVTGASTLHGGAAVTGGTTTDTLHATGAVQVDGAATFGTEGLTTGSTVVTSASIGIAQNCTNGEMDPWKVYRTVSGSTYGSYQVATTSRLALYDTQYGYVWHFDFGGNFNVDQPLYVGSASTLAGGATVSNGLTTDTLHSTGAATLSSTLSVANSLTVASGATLTGNQLYTPGGILYINFDSSYGVDFCYNDGGTPGTATFHGAIKAYASSSINNGDLSVTNIAAQTNFILTNTSTNGGSWDFVTGGSAGVAAGGQLAVYDLNAGKTAFIISPGGSGASFGYVTEFNLGNVSGAPVVLEIGNTNGTAANAYIDFHSCGANNDYDVRVYSSGGTSGTIGKGSLNAVANMVNFTTGLGTTTFTGTEIYSTSNLSLQYSTGASLDLCSGGGTTTIHGPVVINNSIQLGTAAGLSMSSVAYGECHPWYVQRSSSAAVYQYCTTARVGVFDNGAGTVWDYAFGGVFTINPSLTLNNGISIAGATIAPTASATDNSTTIATTKFVKSNPATAKAWVVHDASGNITETYNVSSVTKNATGDFTLNMPSGTVNDANYAYSLAMETDTTSGAILEGVVRYSGGVKSTTQFRYRSIYASGGGNASAAGLEFSVIIYGS